MAGGTANKENGEGGGGRRRGGGRGGGETLGAGLCGQTLCKTWRWHLQPRRLWLIHAGDPFSDQEHRLSRRPPSAGSPFSSADMMK